MFKLNRRYSLGALGASLLLAALPAPAQPSPYRVSWMSPTSAVDGSPFPEELRNGWKWH